jgi:hypothetical protein
MALFQIKKILILGIYKLSVQNFYFLWCFRDKCSMLVYAASLTG